MDCPFPAVEKLVNRLDEYVVISSDTKGGIGNCMSGPLALPTPNFNVLSLDFICIYAMCYFYYH